MTTPMMQQWHAAKSEHADGILFFRMGDFYEFFHDDAKRAASLLGLTLTARSKGDDAIPMAGVPVRAVDGYIERLVRQGEKVVICEQTEDPGAAAGIVRREVTRIVTPGTITEGEALSATDANHLVAVVPAGERIGLSWVDLSTGQFFVLDVPAAEAADRIAALEPAELLLPETFALEDAGGRGLAEGAGCPVTTRPDWGFDARDARRKLSEHFGTRGLSGFGVDDDHPALGAAGAVLAYLRETQRGAIGQVRALRVERRGSAMVLDRTTRAALELVCTLREGERKGSLLGVVDRTATAMGARRLKAWLAAPLCRADAVKRRQDAVAELVDDAPCGEELREALEGVLDLERLAARVGCGRASPRDLAALRQSIGRLPRVAEVLAGRTPVLLQELVEALPDLSALHDLLERALVDEPPMSAGEGGVIRDEHDPALAELRALSRDARDTIASFQAREIERSGIGSLKIGYNRVFGYYIEITNAHRGKVPADYQRKQTLKNAERYVTPELKEFEDRVLNAEERGNRLELELFAELRRAAEERLDALQTAAEIVAVLDVLQSFARLARERGWVRPEVHDGFEIDIEEGRHPVVEALAQDEPFVPNDLRLDEDRRLMLITGPNMAGKSTYIRQAAVLVLLAQTGSFIPARRARIGVVDRVFTRIGASDDLARGSSTFMVEMLEVANILNNAGPRSLVILDEVGRGTSTYDGLSLAWAISEHLARAPRCKTLFATHYHELTELAERVPGVVNANVAVREWGDEIVFLRRIVEGGADKSYGIHVARLACLPRPILDAARAILDDLERLPSRRPTVEPAAAVAERQLDLFTASSDPVRERLAALDVDELTPLQALVALSELRDLAREGRR